MLLLCCVASALLLLVTRNTVVPLLWARCSSPISHIRSQHKPRQGVVFLHVAPTNAKLGTLAKKRERRSGFRRSIGSRHDQLQRAAKDTPRALIEAAKVLNCSQVLQK